jgi:metal-responsive CopG/Arc/MetJ family transcriptional regulator
MESDVEGILIGVYNVEGGHGLDRVGHRFQKNITTQIHSHLRSGKCLDVFFVGGDR